MGNLLCIPISCPPCGTVEAYSCLVLNYACMHAKPRCSAKGASTDHTFSLVSVCIMTGHICTSEPILQLKHTPLSLCCNLHWPQLPQEDWVAKVKSPGDVKRVFPGFDRSFYLHGHAQRYKNDLNPHQFSSRWLGA